ncbi:hypothetical protein M422DRAFT_776285 [Sphaerobolus stellatus SS14]|nr:hypothetical protein M422DRAFT_776285 [Sphaerobolus stellatus SS14]
MTVDTIYDQPTQFADGYSIISASSPPLTPSNSSISESVMSPISTSIHEIRKLDQSPNYVLNQYLHAISSPRRGILHNCVHPGCQSKPWKSLSAAYSHVRNHLKLKTHECVTCDILFASQSAAIRHTKTEKVYKRLSYDKYYSRPDYLSIHFSVLGQTSLTQLLRPYR